MFRCYWIHITHQRFDRIAKLSVYKNRCVRVHASTYHLSPSVIPITHALPTRKRNWNETSANQSIELIQWKLSMGRKTMNKSTMIPTFADKIKSYDGFCFSSTYFTHFCSNILLCLRVLMRRLIDMAIPVK